MTTKQDYLAYLSFLIFNSDSTQCEKIIKLGIKNVSHVLAVAENEISLTPKHNRIEDARHMKNSCSGKETGVKC